MKYKASFDRFERLNPYDRRYIKGSILSLVKANHVDTDSSKPRRQLYGYSVSSKRYAIYEKIGRDDIKVVEPKAHGLGYLAAPKEEKRAKRETGSLKLGIGSCALSWA